MYPKAIDIGRDVMRGNRCLRNEAFRGYFDVTECDRVDDRVGTVAPR